ncbi:hypothetical protein GCM10020216_038520 [Nonomuraea helvata]
MYGPPLLQEPEAVPIADAEVAPEAAATAGRAARPVVAAPATTRAAIEVRKVMNAIVIFLSHVSIGLTRGS